MPTNPAILKSCSQLLRVRWVDVDVDVTASIKHTEAVVPYLADGASCLAPIHTVQHNNRVSEWDAAQPGQRTEVKASQCLSTFCAQKVPIPYTSAD